MREECDCGETLEYLAATQPELMEHQDKTHFLKTERRIFYACNACKNVYEAMETVRLGKTGRTVTCELAPYLGDLCWVELKGYAHTKSGRITRQDELDIVSQFAKSLRSTK